MSQHHKHASVAVAQTLFDGMPPAEQAQVLAEAEAKGVSPIEIVRLSLDILIAESRPASAPVRGTGPTGA